MYIARLMRRRAQFLAAGAALVLASGLAACGSDSGDDATATASESVSSAPSSSAPADSDSLAAEVAALSQPLDAYPVPTDPIDGVASLSGKTVYYIPITSQAPAFDVTGRALTTALSAAGISVQICDGKGTPTTIDACISQATNSKAGAIVADSIAYALATNGFDSAQAAGIPVVIANQLPDPGHPASDTLVYVAPGGSQMEEALAKWVSLDSEGTANVLINQSADGPSPAAYVEAGKKVYASDCPDCTITINPVTSANFGLVPASTSAALLKDPAIDYVESQFEQYLQVTQNGVQQAGSTAKLIDGAAGLGSIKAVADGTLAAGSGQANAFGGWVDADAALRLMLGQSVPEYTIPVRLFVKDAMGDVALTQEAEDSGEWFGPATFTDEFKKLWGLA